MKFIIEINLPVSVYFFIFVYFLKKWLLDIPNR